MDGHIEILKSLVDSLTLQLTNILIKIESITPILNRILDEEDDIEKNSLDNKESLNQIKNEIYSYHQCMVDLPDTIKIIDTLKTDIENIKKLLIPINKFARFVMRPIGVVLFLLSAGGIFVGIIETVKFFTKGG